MAPQSYAVIMAGGSGERLWPLSTPDHPKQFVKLFEERSLLRGTVDRLSPLIPIERQLVVTSLRYVELVRAEIPELPPWNLIWEPVGRNTAACIGLASLFIERRAPDALAVILPADHYIPDAAAFLAAVERAVLVAAARDGTVVIGVEPDRPETGYGYIQIGQEIAPEVHPVLHFHEKPDRPTAERYLLAGDYFWNTGIFVWQNRTLQHLLLRHLPDHWAKLEQIRAALSAAEYADVVAKVYPSLQGVSIDHGVIEKTRDMAMVPGRFPWDDLGSWAAVERLLSRDGHGNAIVGRHVGIDTAGCTVWGSGEGVIATIGLRDLIVIQTATGLLICSKDQAQAVRNLRERLDPAGKGEWRT